ncbi:hypothetical protein ALQ28_103501 [Pseudomonas syringae pv. delphinii]|uniref:Uncharacterized protein n=1 Tax=Pseudomonas syringae pv. delphinii TaxID=192088 RepID=A0A3M4AVL6_9PSED|nr:hypothetical protein ALQ28_103501 [Pseudomonas syringae pv. delphinii]RMP23694.1 hypothetical protein ALQ27_103754 [Pseudomonas syringae pv. delphinii]
MPETVAVADHFRFGPACRESVGFCPFPFSGNGAQQIIELGNRHDGRRREHGKGLDGLQILLSELPNGQGVEGQNAPGFVIDPQRAAHAVVHGQGA